MAQNNFIVRTPAGEIKIVSEKQLFLDMQAENNNDVIVGRLSKIKDPASFLNCQRLLKDAEVKQKETKKRLMSLVRQHAEVLAGQTKDNLIFNFRELITSKL